MFGIPGPQKVCPDRPFFDKERTVAKHPELAWSTRDIQGSLPSDFSIII